MHLKFPLAFSLAAVLALCSTAEAAKSEHHSQTRQRTYLVKTVTVTAVPVAQEDSLRWEWVQAGPNGFEARAVMEGKACPTVFVDLHDEIMQTRSMSDEKFTTLCATLLPKETKQAAIAFRVFHSPPPDLRAGLSVSQAWAKEEYGVPMPGPNAGASEWVMCDQAVKEKTRYRVVPLPLPPTDPQRIVVLGDTGCRIKGKELQACNDPDKWPFATIAAEAAKLKPDLVIHVGDYLYRENACPADYPGCQGTPWGDNWKTWDADFFTPAKPLLAAAPWVFVRGNHEDCERAGLGWLKLLGPLAFDPAAPCMAHLAPYSIPLAAMNLVVIDDVTALEKDVVTDMVPVFRSEIRTLDQQPSPSWLLLHRPIWAAISGPLGIPIGGSQTMIAAATNGIPSPVTLMLAGHIHTFEAINYGPSPHVPPQVVAGFGGDNLDPTPLDLKGTIFQGASGVTVRDGVSIRGFGFLLMTKRGDDWIIEVHDVHGAIERQCLFHSGRVDCPSGN